MKRQNIYDGLWNKVRYCGVIRRGEYGYFLRFQIRQRFNNLILNYNSNNWSEEQQETHDLIKSLHDSGLGYRKIAKRLNEEGIKTFKGKTWGNNNVHSVLKRNKEKLQREERGKQESEIEYGKMELVWLREGELWKNPRKELTSLPKKSNQIIV